MIRVKSTKTFFPCFGSVLATQAGSCLTVLCLNMLHLAYTNDIFQCISYSLKEERGGIFDLKI